MPSRAYPLRSAARRTSSCRGKGVSVKRLPGWYGGQLIGPAPTPHCTLGGQHASTGYGPVSDTSASAQPSQGRTKAWWPPRDTTSR